MKRSLKIFALIICCCIISLSLCSCKQLDELKATHAFWTDEDHSEVLFNGTVYKKLPRCDDFYPNMSNYGRLTENDVPVLLSDFFGSTFYYSDDYKVLKTIYGDNNIYCTEELYDEYTDRILNYKLDNFCILTHQYNEEKGTYDTLPELLNENAKQAVLETLLQEPESVERLGNYSFEYSISLIQCDSTADFRRYNYEMGIINNEVYIFDYSKNTTQYVYKVSSKKAPILTEYIIK